jgi:hypothetical protein
MAKRAATKGKPKQYKRETNAERRAREDERRRILEMAKGIAGAIRTRRAASSARERELFKYFEQVMRIVSTRPDDEGLKSESVENIAESLRLAADVLEEKPMDQRSLNWHDGKIIAAYIEAARRVWRDAPDRINPCYEDDILRISTGEPTFAEFLEVYREQNPSVRVEERSLRRALKRLGSRLPPGNRGRPRKNGGRT